MSDLIEPFELSIPQAQLADLRDRLRPAPMRTPTSISMFPKELVRISRRWAETRFSNLVHFNELGAGGHFAALEQPVLLTEEIRAGFRGLRA